jgi:hypothetical protein
MHHAGAARAEPSQAAEAGSVGPELDLIESRSSWLLAAQTEEPARSAGTLPSQIAPSQEVGEVRAPDDRRVAGLYRMQSIPEPVPDGAGRSARDLGCFPDIVRAQVLDPPGRVSPICHRT